LANILENHLPLRDKVYHIIRKAILERELKPGKRLTEMEISNKYGISRTPIREAFRKLESEGFLTIVPRKGAIVTDLNEQTVLEFYQIKGALEALAGRLALKNFTEEDIKELEELNNKLKSFEKEDNTSLEDFNKIHNQFHRKFIVLSKNKLLIEILDNLTKRYLRFRLMVEHTDFIDEVIAQHEEIIDAFKKNDEELVSKCIKKNAELGSELIRKYYINKE